jgi:hypothetical protein
MLSSKLHTKNLKLSKKKFYNNLSRFYQTKSSSLPWLLNIKNVRILITDNLTQGQSKIFWESHWAKIKMFFFILLYGILTFF